MSKLEKLKERQLKIDNEIQRAYRASPEIDSAVDIAQHDGHPMALSYARDAQAQHRRAISRLEREEREVARLIDVEEARLQPKPDAPDDADDASEKKPNKRPSLAYDFEP